MQEDLLIILRHGYVTEVFMEKSTLNQSSKQEETSNIHHFFSKQVQDKIARHPCYSKDAHQYARMHLPVAPACNIQCNYCNRKYDCSNESRPGVVSRVASPDIALKQFMAVKKRAPNLSVVGIAGPGDALANPQATFKTLNDIRNADPSVQLCISTNGLMLEPYVNDLIQSGVNHLTITINCTDPEIGAQIYPWVYFDHKRLRGIEAAKTLIGRQFAGLKSAADAGMLVKVNTVLIPGINDHHIQEVSKAVKAHGALLHNIMPLISDPAHGTYFGLTHQRGPSEAELEKARADSGNNMPQMTHCQQCRADAVGTLGGCSATEPDNSSQPSPDASRYRIAIANNSDSDIIQVHFGHARWFEIYEYSEKEKRFHFTEKRFITQYCQGTNECNDALDEKEQIIRSVSDCDMVLCARIGIAPWRDLERLGVIPNVDYAMQPINKALQHIKQIHIKTQPKTQEAAQAGGPHEVCHNR
ncbi:nitrogenase cofactor biosynthesis protein NifB [Vibrio salinus]|uniref:nitrogenase cofactor biosynthesis protein NifB n=1 Tax=Vibrio salinus TaxID=2899784 RepID=UPI001E4036F0|nr:nitrogenase cofactor biosynthesis protein NifB [Vibrio salinus]MCE0495517.1 nitrogenase cofactor biosynthesis protein NifB [Vibrio salinus]